MGLYKKYLIFWTINTGTPIYFSCFNFCGTHRHAIYVSFKSDLQITNKNYLVLLTKNKNTI